MFDVSCKTNTGWIKVLDQTSTSAIQQFETTANPPEPQYPCTACWVKLEFDSECTGSACRIENTNGPTFHGRIYLFEVVFAQDSAPELPPSLPPKVLGYCIKHQEVAINSDILGECYGKMGSAKPAVAEFQADFASVPCGSQFAMEDYIPHVTRWGGGTGGTRICGQNNKSGVRTSDGEELLVTCVSDGCAADSCPNWNKTQCGAQPNRKSVQFSGCYSHTAQVNLRIAMSTADCTLMAETQVA